jgi:hypothetical protein
MTIDRSRAGSVRWFRAVGTAFPLSTSLSFSLEESGYVLEHDPAECGKPPDKHARRNKELERDATFEIDSIRSHPAPDEAISV